MDVARDILGVLFAGLWQGLLVAVLAAAALAGLRRASASTRHAVLWCALLAIVVIPLVTTISGQSADTNGFASASYTAALQPVASMGGAGMAASTMREIRVYIFDEAAFALCALWLAGLIWRLSAAVGSGLRVAQIRRACVLSGSRDGIPIYVSDAVALPISIGFVRPAVVVPRCFLDVLTPENLECVVQHEVAHVLRRDVWTKGAQICIEAVFFFNPAVLFIGRKIAFEREAACDDRALACIPDVRHYADCLARVASLVSQTHRSAALVLGFGNTTLSRVRRLMDGRRNARTSISSLTLGGSVMILATIAFVFQTLAPVVAFSGTNPQPPLIAQANASPTPINVNLAAPSRTAATAEPIQVKLDCNDRAALKLAAPTRTAATGEPIQVKLDCNDTAALKLAAPARTVAAAPIKVKLDCNDSAGVTYAAAPAYPTELKSSKTPLVVLVALNINAKGKLTQARIKRSSGNVYGDRAALEAVRQSTYHPGYRNCKAVAGTYTYRVEFSAGTSK